VFHFLFSFLPYFLLVQQVISTARRVADAILDRIAHNAYRVELSGDSLRKQSRRIA
jgi:DNA replication protein DnaC